MGDVHSPRNDCPNVAAAYTGYMAACGVSATGLCAATAAAGEPKWAAEHVWSCSAGLCFPNAHDREGGEVPDAEQAAHELHQEQDQPDEDLTSIHGQLAGSPMSRYLVVKRISLRLCTVELAA